MRTAQVVQKRPEIPPVCGSPRQCQLPEKASGLDKEKKPE